jgi:hypothetical protein
MTATGHLQQSRCECLRSLLELAVDRVDRPRQCAAATDELARNPLLHGLLATNEPAAEPVEPNGAFEPAERDVQR